MEYEGTRYCGFQVQKDKPTIQGELERALWKLTGERIRIKAAGRTDAGVHAEGQVIACEIPDKLSPEEFVEGMNFYLPEDIAVRAARPVPPDFDPRRHARSREYRYTIITGRARSPLWRRTALWIRHPLDFEAMREVSSLFVGRHDFAPFTAPEARGRNTVREVFRAELRREDRFIFFEVEANSFLPQQVRRMMGTLIEVGMGRRGREEVEELLRSGEPGAAKYAAPPHGLCLVRVNYPDLSFEG